VDEFLAIKIENNAGISRTAWDYLMSLQNLISCKYYHTSNLRRSTSPTSPQIRHLRVAEDALQPDMVEMQGVEGTSAQ